MQGKRVLKKQKQQSNHSLLGTYFISLFSVLLSFGMLLGTTFALFYTSNTSVGNEINSGRLQVDMIHVSSDGKEYSLRAHPGHEVFSSSAKWRPGVSQIETIRVCNVGNVDLKYTLDFVPDPQYDYEAVQAVSGLFSVSVKVDDAVGWTTVGTLDEVMNGKADCYLHASSEVLGPGKEQLIQIELRVGGGNELARAMTKKIPLRLKLDAIQPEVQEENIQL